MDFNAGMSVRPRSASEYLTVGGIVLYCVRFMKLSCSSSRRHLVNIVAVMPTT